MGSIAKREGAAGAHALKNLFEKKHSDLTALTGGDKDQANRLIKCALLEAATNENIGNCTKESIYKSVVEAAASGADLAFGAGEGFLIPYGTTCKFIAGYKLWVRKIAEAGYQLSADVIRENDHYEYSAAPRHFVHRPNALAKESERGAIIGAYAAVYNLSSNGERHLVDVELMSVEELNRAKKGNSEAWQIWQNKMYVRLPIKRVAARLDCSRSNGLRELLRIDAANESGRTIDINTPPEFVDPPRDSRLDAGTHWGFPDRPEPGPEKTEEEPQQWDPKTGEVYDDGMPEWSESEEG